MKVNQNYIKLSEQYLDSEKLNLDAFSESEFINNLMLNPAKYREFKRNINRINNIDNEINYLKAQEQKNQIDFINNIKITLKEYESAIEMSNNLYENLNEVQIIDLLSHKKLLSNEKHLVEAMAYFIGVENLDWNTFKLTFNLDKAKAKMKNIDYSRISKKKINTLLGQLCRADSIKNFLSENDFGDSGMEFIYEWVKCQIKIYFYLYQNKKIPKQKSHKKCKTTHLSLKKDIIMNDNRLSPIINGRSNHFYNTYNKENKQTDVKNKQASKKINIGYSTSPISSKGFSKNFLMTALPFANPNESENVDNNFYYTKKNFSKKKFFSPTEVSKINIKLKGYNVHKDKIIREIRTAEMLPFLKNKTYHQLRGFFDDKMPVNKEIEKQHKKDVINYALNGKKSEKKLMWMIANGKTKVMNYLSLYRLKQILGN